jgi:hypothetical protein
MARFEPYPSQCTFDEPLEPPVEPESLWFLMDGPVELGPEQSCAHLLELARTARGQEDICAVENPCDRWVEPARLPPWARQ